MAAAEDNGELRTFVDWLIKAKKSPNLTQLALTTMPKGRGRKGCAPPPRKKKKVAAKSRKTFAQLLKEHCSTSGAVDKGELQSDASGDSSSEDMLTQPTVTCSGATLELSPTRSRVQSGEVTGAASDRYPVCEYVSLQGGGIEFSHSSSGTKLNVSGGLQESRSTSGLPLAPPPLVHCPTSQTSPSLQSPFELAFVSGNIRVCRGCKQKYTKPASPPLDLCIRHKEWQEYLGPLGTPQTRYGNVYYNCNIPGHVLGPVTRTLNPQCCQSIPVLPCS